MDRAAEVLDCAVARRADVATLGKWIDITAAGHEFPEAGRPLSRIEWERPPEAEIEQAAARCRPLFLNNDACFHARMTKGLVYLARDAPQPTTKMVNDCKQVWADLPGASRWSLMVAEGESVGANLTDREIQEAWFNGFILHHKPDARAKLRLIGSEQRYLAGLAWISDGCGENQLLT